MTLTGTQIDRYEVEEEIGRGGMGVVYKAKDCPLDRSVALKVLTEAGLADGKARARFQKEIESAVAIEHPHVVPVYDAGYDGKNFYIATRFVDGPDLAALLSDEGSLAEGRTLRLVAQIANALYSMHKVRMVHRDVKPHNVLVWEAGSRDEHAMLTDFGIAKALDETGTLTSIGPPGTPAYMAPELSLGRPPSAASDQYSLACMAYELLSGTLPFEVPAIRMGEAHAEMTPVPLMEVAGISTVVSDAIERGMAKNPAERFPDVRDLVRTVGASETFTESERIRAVSSDAEDTSEQAVALLTQTDLSDRRAAVVTGLERGKVARLRRRIAREALIGSHHSRDPG